MDHPLINTWRNCSLNHPPYCLPDDQDIVLAKSKRVPYFSFQDFIASEDFGQASGKFHLGLMPQPFIGHLHKASVFLFMLNPGFSPGDYYALEHSKEFRQAVERNIHQLNQDDEYPFFYLNPSFSWTPGGAWWQNKFRFVAQHLISEGICHTFQKALQHISQQVACLELFPYYSKHFSQPKYDLHSTSLLRQYVKEVVVPKAQNNEALLIITRQVKSWGLPANKNTVLYTGGQARAASLSLDSPGGDSIAQWLQRK